MFSVNNKLGKFIWIDLFLILYTIQKVKNQSNQWTKKSINWSINQNTFDKYKKIYRIKIFDESSFYPLKNSDNKYKGEVHPPIHSAFHYT